MYNEEEITKINEATERKELLEWIPKLVKENLNDMTTEQLRILHYILGYYCSEADPESIIEEFEQNNYDEEMAMDILTMLKRDGFFIIERPY